MRNPAVNAFTINRLGFKDGSMFFPLSLEVSQHGDVVHAYICAQQVVDLCDIIEKHALDYLVVFGVDVSAVDGHFARGDVQIAGLATHANLSHTSIDSQTIVLHKEELCSLLTTFDHYDLSLFDIGRDWSELQVIDQVLVCREHDWRTRRALLSKLSASTLSLDSHDDCYLAVESHSPELAKDVFVRTFEIFAATTLARNVGSSVQIAEMPRALLDSFWKDDFALSMLQEETGVDGDRLEIGVSRQAFRFGENGEYRIDFWLVYDVQSGQWSMEN